MRSFRLLYDEWLHRQPLLTKAVTTSILFAFGDRIAQRVEALGESDEQRHAREEKEAEAAKDESRWMSESAAKTVRMMAWGGLLMTPMMHTWYNLVDRFITGSGKVVVAKKVVSDMLLVAPQMPIWFYTSTGLMAGKPLKQAFDESIEKLPMTLAANYMLWPAANSINFALIPLEYRLLFGNFVHVGWSSFLSHMANTPIVVPGRSKSTSNDQQEHHQPQSSQPVQAS